MKDRMNRINKLKMAIFETKDNQAEIKSEMIVRVKVNLN